MAKQLLFIILALYAFQANAQSTFQKTYGAVGTDGVELIETNDLNMAILSSGLKGLELVYMDHVGQIKRTVYYKNISSFLWKNLFQLKNGDFIVSGFISSSTSDGSIIIRTDSTGNVIWSKSYTSASGGNLILKTLKPTTDGGFIVAGETDYNTKGLVVKLDASGNVIWTRQIGSGSDDYSCLDIIQSKKDSSFIVFTMSLQGSHTDNHGMLSKFDKAGVYQWSRLIAPNLSFAGTSTYQLRESGDRKLQFSYNNFNLMEFDEDGNNGRQLELYDYDYLIAWSPSQSKDNGYLVTGYKSGDMYVANLDSAGNYKWGKYIGGVKADAPSCLKQLSDKSIVIAGYTQNFTMNDYAAYLIKMDSTGYTSCNSRPFTVPKALSSSVISTPRNPDIGTSYFVRATPLSIQADLSFKDSASDACGCVKPIAAFDTGNSSELRDKSKWAAKWHWYSSSGTQDTSGYLPNLKFPSDGKYLVCLTVKNACGSDSVCHYYDWKATTVSVDDEHVDESKISIYPNPFTSQTTISFPENQEGCIVKMIDVLGKEVKMIKFIGKELVIDKGELNPGIYFIHLLNEKSNKVLIKKVVIF
jgi:hypothetical protein